MASFVNKMMSSVTNSTSSLIGRENLTKLSNTINRTFKSSKYREFLKAGNVVQLISKNSHMSLQICSSQNDVNRLILLANGQIGPEYRNAHFTIIKDAKNGHYKFQNGPNFVAFDEPCIRMQPFNFIY